MAKEMTFRSLTETEQSPAVVAREAHPIIEMRQFTRAPISEMGRKEQEFSLDHLRAFEEKTEVISRVLARAFEVHRSGASANELGKALRLAGRDVIEGEQAQRCALQIAIALETAAKLTHGGTEDLTAVERLYDAVDNIARLSPDVAEKVTTEFEHKIQPVIEQLRQRKREIAERVVRPSGDLEALVRETEAMETELMEINRDLPVASKFRNAFSTFRDEARALRDAALQVIQRRQQKAA